MIAKGTKVLVKTTNGGEIIAKLYERYRPTYDVVLEHNGHVFVISVFRLKSIEATSLKCHDMTETQGGKAGRGANAAPI